MTFLLIMQEKLILFELTLKANERKISDDSFW